MAIEGMKAQLLLLQEGLKIKKIRQIFKAYTFSLNILKMNVGLYVEQPGKIGENFTSEFLKQSNNINNNNNNSSIKDDNFCINKEIKEQSIINFNAMNNNMNIEINETANRLVDEYLSRFNNPINNFVPNDTIFTFVIGLYDKVRYNIELFLKEKNQNNENKYKSQIVSLCETFWNFLNKYVEILPLLRTNIFKTIIIKLFSSCSHIYFINKEFNKINQIINYFDKLSNELNINESTPSYELALKVKGDLYFSQNDYNNSISCYKQSAKLMHDINPKKAIVYFNLGVLYYYINDKLAAIENFQKAVTYFKRSEEEKYSFEIHKRNNVLTKKINLTNALIKKIQEN
jgi:tetratricopeptide (TPR) repeat protein